MSFIRDFVREISEYCWQKYSPVLLMCFAVSLFFCLFGAFFGGGKELIVTCVCKAGLFGSSVLLGDNGLSAADTFSENKHGSCSLTSI